MDAKLLNPSVLSFVGDAVYGLYVREKLAEINRPSGQLHSLSVRFVNAKSQCDAFKLIEPLLTETEMAVFKRGRNFHTGNTPKNATKGEYHTATGLETLFGFLHLSGELDREKELFRIIWENFSQEL